MSKNTHYGFRPGKSAHQAVKKAQEYVQQGYRIVVDIDLEKFFDRVNHDILMSRLARKIKDKRLLKIIRSFLEAGIMADGVCISRYEGTPQGGPLSPLLSNILLDELDKELERRGHRFCRYADDCNTYVKSHQAGLRVMESIKQFLMNKLKLKINETKSGVARVMERKFLGFRLLQNGKISLAQKSEERLKGAIRKITKRNRGASLERVISDLNQKLKGWINYFKIVESQSKFHEMDAWIRRKLRCYRLKQRKRSYPIARFLIEMGVTADAAWRIAKSERGWWRISKTPPVHQAMSVAWFEERGLISLQKQASSAKV